MPSGGEANYLNGEFASCMGQYLFGSPPDEFRIALTQCLDATGQGGTKDGRLSFLQKTSAELSVLAFLISLVSVVINGFLLCFLCGRRDYQELGTEEPDCAISSEDEEPATPVKRYANTKTSVWDQDFANFGDVK
mmetsp:Transcript_45585/g.105757  ORF Transcript_45585/g.105757 Transcript_45585/m.105757 type:complete len:135 (-) Transcript_45585:153-557(-)